MEQRVPVSNRHRADCGWISGQLVDRYRCSSAAKGTVRNEIRCHDADESTSLRMGVDLALYRAIPMTTTNETKETSLKPLQKKKQNT